MATEVDYYIYTSILIMVFLLYSYGLNLMKHRTYRFLASSEKRIRLEEKE